MNWFRVSTRIKLATCGAAIEEGDFDEEDFCDFEHSDEDEDEEETVQLGSSNMSPEDIEAAEKYFEQKYSLNNAAAKRSGSPAPNGIASQEQQREEMDSDDENLHEGIGVRLGNQAQAGHQNSQRAPVFVLPLYAMLPPEEQSKVFEDPPAGHRLIIVATNVAETSLTIPGIRFATPYCSATGTGVNPASCGQKGSKSLDWELVVYVGTWWILEGRSRSFWRSLMFIDTK